MKAKDNFMDAVLSRRSFLKYCAGIIISMGAGAMSQHKQNEGKVHDTTEKKDVGSSSSSTLVTGFVYDERYVEFLQPSGGMWHPECPERLKFIIKRLKDTGLMKKLRLLKPVGDPMQYIKMIHPESHIQKVTQQTEQEDICRLAVSGVMTGVDAVFKGDVKNVFCAVRPPGHHAVDFGEYGFCFYNNVAIAARYAQKKYNVERVLIADWDFHHGNGTEWAFYEDPSVLFFSTHALYAFPGTGFPERRGKGKKEGLNINVPLPAGADDETIIKAFTEKLLPVAEKFKPELVIISAGFDCRKDDRLGNFNVTDEGIAKLTKLVMEIAKKHAKSRLVSVLEGGYNLEGLALAVEAHVIALLEG